MSSRLSALFRALTHGVYVVGVCGGERKNAFTAAWIMQASFEPPLLALSINPAHSSYTLLREGNTFAVSVLGSDHQALARHFGQSAAVDKLAGIDWRPGRSGAPILTGALAWFECELTGECAAGDHIIVLGRVIDGDLAQPAGTPMNYRDTGDMDGSRSLYPDAFQPS